MRTRILLTIVTLAFLCPSAFSAQVWEVSNSFAIDNTKGDTLTRPPSATAYSPYSNGATWNLLRGQLHTHRHSDFPLDFGGIHWPIWTHRSISETLLTQEYTYMGFDFLALTGHDVVSGESVGWQGWAPHSVELTNATHTLVIGSGTEDLGVLSYGDTGNIVNDVAERVRRAHANSALAFIAHPCAPWFGLSTNQVVSIYKDSKPDGISIYQVVSKAENLWDRILQNIWPNRIWGYSEDDYHPYMAEELFLGSTWIGVPGNEGEWWGNIKPQLASGNYYTYWTNLPGWHSPPEPPRLKVNTDSSGTYPVITASLTDGNGNPYVADIYFKTAIGFSGATGSSISYPCIGNEKYVRVKVVKALGAGLQLNIASQPILISGGGLSARVASELGFQLQSTSPELHLRYLGEGETPEPPQAGYIGFAFDVTTDTSTCPPGATLQLSYAGEDIGPLGDTQYLAIYYYDEFSKHWVKVGGTVDPGTETIESPITALGKYCISADLPEDITAPVITIDNPACGSVVAANTNVTATVDDDLGAWRVKFYMNGHLLSEDADGMDGWSADIPLADYCTGDWMLTAEAEDMSGNIGTTEIPVFIRSNTVPPTVSISSPSVGSILSGTVTVTGNCGDDVAINAVTLYIGDVAVGSAEVSGTIWACDIDVSSLPGGDAFLAAVAADEPGNEATASVAVQINSSPTVTINQATGQIDPTNGSPIDFTVVFSEPVSDFATGDVTISGTAGGAKTATVTGSGTTYNVAVTGITTSGTVIASLAAGVAHDEAGNASNASTSADNTVTFQVSRTIGANVTLKNWAAASGVTLPFQVKCRKSGTSDTPTIVDMNLLVTPGGGVGTASFSLTNLAPGSYDVWVKCTQWLAWKLTGVNVTAGDSTGNNFALTNADINGDNVVNFSDYLILQTQYKKSPVSPTADINGDGAVNFSDYLILQANYKKTGDVL